MHFSLPNALKYILKSRKMRFCKRLGDFSGHEADKKYEHDEIREASFDLNLHPETFLFPIHEIGWNEWSRILKADF